jgi:predicted outer membrane protein
MVIAAGAAGPARNTWLSGAGWWDGRERAGSSAGPRAGCSSPTAYMMLVTCNTQGELTALERGLHALHRPEGMDVKAYAASIGRARTTVQRETYAAAVASAVPINGHELDDFSTHMVEIHAAPAWLWPTLVAAMLPSTRR